MAAFLILAWIIGVIVPFGTGHPLWGIAAVLCPPLAVVIGGFWIVVGILLFLEGLLS